MSLLFFLNAVLFGIALAMDAFSVSLANGLNEPEMPGKRMCLIAGTFCFFQIIMPLIGWICIHTVAKAFAGFQKFIPWIALVLLLYIGGKMLVEVRHPETEQRQTQLGFGELMVQGVATAIDALSVGFTIAELDFLPALVEALIIGTVTFAICMGGLAIGKKFGTKLAGKASVLGGCILIAIGIEIFIKGIFF